MKSLVSPQPGATDVSEGLVQDLIRLKGGVWGQPGDIVSSRRAKLQQVGAARGESCMQPCKFCISFSSGTRCLAAGGLNGQILA